MAAIVDLVDVVAGRMRVTVDHAQICQLQAIGNIAEHAILDEANRQHHWRLRDALGIGMAGRHCSHHGEPVVDIEQEHRLGDVAQLRQPIAAHQAHGSIGKRGAATAQIFDDGMQARDCRGDQAGIRLIASRLRVDDLIG